MGYRAFVVNKDGDDFAASVQTLDESSLPEGNVTVAVEWSDLNYKDGLACTPNGRVVTKLPDDDRASISPAPSWNRPTPRYAVGRCSRGDRLRPRHRDIRVDMQSGCGSPADWLSPLPRRDDFAEEAMVLGTAGITAAMSIDVIEKAGIGPDSGPVIVSGATGGVGSTAVAMLAARGYTVHASTGKSSEHEFLRDLGARPKSSNARSWPPSRAGRWSRSAGQPASTRSAVQPLRPCCARPGTAASSPSPVWPAASRSALP